MACKSWYDNFYEKVSKTLIRDNIEKIADDNLLNPVLMYFAGCKLSLLILRRSVYNITVYSNYEGFK